LDGRREALDVQVEYARLTGGEILPHWDLDRIIADLDAHLLLDTPRLEARRLEIEEAYRTAPCRSLAHAGISYPADRDALRARLQAYMDDASATLPGGAAARPAGANGLRGLLAPHIDFQRGGPSYGRAYRVLGSVPEGASVIVFGVAHAAPPTPFVLTRKGYAVPGGVLEVDSPLVDDIVSRCPFDVLAHEAVHRREHSIEFQALFLDHIAPDRPLTIVPILCSSFEPWCGRDSPSGMPQIEAFIGAVRAAIEAAGRPVLVVAGVDLSHVGSRFGDAEHGGPTLGAAARAGDLAALDRVAAGDAEGFWRTVMADGNRHRVCGLSAIYTVLRVLSPVRGQILDYRQGEDPAGGLVGFAAVALNGAALGDE
jgi:AmmeMemoRadiSam system protein B